MTPLYTLTIGGMTVFRGFQGFDDQIFAIFSESERTATTIRHGPSEEDETDEFTYRTTVRHLAQRLDLMGFTEGDCKEEFADGIRHYIAELEENLSSQERFVEDYPEQVAEKITSTREAIDAMKTVRLCEWVEAFDLVIDHVYLSDEEIKNLPALHRHLLQAEERAETYVPFSDLRRLVRAFLCCVDPEEDVILDYTTAIYEEKCSANSLLAENAKESLADSARPVEKIILMTEGPTDALILSRSLDRLFPHIAELFSFLDHTTFSLGGGTANIVSLLKGLASCGIANRVVAIFDNDAAGTAYKRKAEALALPRNFKLVQLPDLDFARKYPTIGPAGSVISDINGSACSIELYLGRSALCQKDGTLMPIQWTGIDRSLNRYQGELLDKKQAQDIFMQSLDALENDSEEFDGIRAILGRIFTVLH